MGSNMTTFAVVLREKDTAGALGVSLAFAAMMIPNIIWAPVAGLLADKYSTRNLVPPMLLLMSLSTVSIAFTPFWWAPIALFITSSAGVVVGAGYQSMLPAVSAPQDLARVNGVGQTYVSVGMLAGPALAGLLVGATGFFWPFIIDFFSFIVLAAAFRFVGLTRTPVVHVDGPKLKAMDGVRELFKDPFLRAIVVMITAIVAALGIVNVGEVFLITDELNASAFIYGIVGSLFAAGSLIGAFVVSKLKLTKRQEGYAAVFSPALLVLSVMGLSLAPDWGWAMVTTFIAGLGNAAINSYGVALIMERSKEEARGRIMAAFGAMVTSGGISSLALGGILISAFGVREVLFGGALLSGLVLVALGPGVLRRALHPERYAA